MTRFHRTRQLLHRLRAERTAATAIEYAMIMALIALAIFSSVDLMGEQTAASYQRTGDAIARASQAD